MKKQEILSAKTLASFTQQMQMILHAGISLYEGIAIMQEDQEEEALYDVLRIMQTQLNIGSSFHDALVISRAFPSYLLDMVAIGEKAGRLEEVMQGLSYYYERQHENNENIKSALSYPLFMVFMMLVVVFVLMTQVLPIFNRVFMQLGGSISGFSKWILDVGNLLSTYSYVILTLLLACVLLYLYFTTNKKGKHKLYQFLSTFRWSRTITLKLALAQFTSGLSIALSSGLDVEHSMNMAKALIAHKPLIKQIEQAQALLQDNDIATSLCESHILTGLYARLAKVGYKTGEIDSIMKDIAKRYDKESEEKLTHLISIIEPTLVVILSLFVGLVLLSVMLPLIGIMSSL